jgi:hypothetical protein
MLLACSLAILVLLACLPAILYCVRFYVLVSYAPALPTLPACLRALYVLPIARCQILHACPRYLLISDAHNTILITGIGHGV